jgi:hypothetical protein
MPAPLTTIKRARRRRLGRTTGSQDGVTAIANASEPRVPRTREGALAAARQLLASTAEAITPDTPARELLACLTRYRAGLADLAEASSGSEHGDSQ